MSGPKVVRVVTREELVAAGEALLRRLDAAVGEWERCATQTGVSPADRQNSKERRNALEHMLRADKFNEFTRAATDEIGFLEVDAEKRIERAAQARAQEKVRIASGRELARALLRQGGSSSQATAQLERAAAGELELKELDAVLARAMQLLAQPIDSKMDDAQRELAARLAAGEKGDDIAAWRTRSVAASPQVATLLAQVASLEILGQTGKATQLQQEVLATCALEDEGIRGMRFDSLQVNLKRAREDALALARLRRQATLLSAEASQMLEGVEIVESLTAVAHASADELLAAVKSTQARLDVVRAASAAKSRRHAVLAGLQQLGYQVQDHLSTATTAGGRLVLRSATESNYGVEIAGAGMERMQVRTVALRADRDTSEDIPAEQSWCGDFGELQNFLKSQGAEVLVEKALGVGVAPVKVLAGVPVADGADAPHLAPGHKVSVTRKR